MTPRIELFDAGLGLIIRHPSGVIYTNQTRGVCCDHPEMEGVFVPFDAESTWEQLSDYFVKKYLGRGAMQGIDDEDARFVEAILREARIGIPVVVDRSRLAASHEAWVHVVIEGDGDSWSTISGFGPYPIEAVLTWPNSD